MSACPTLGSDDPFVSGMLGYIDCQAVTLGANGYQILAAPGSTASILLGIALTLFVASYGYRMLFGEVPGTRDATLALVKIGFVLALATSWGAYRTLVYDVVLRGPAELAAEIGGSAALPGAGGGLVERLQYVDDALIELSKLGTGKPPDADPITGPTVPLTPTQQAQQLRELRDQSQRPRWDPQRDLTLLNEARTLYLTGAVGSFAAVRVVGGLLLALGPVFALFMLFDGTRGVFEGWLRALGGVTLGALSSAVVLGVQLALFEPWLAAILADRRAFLPTPAVPVELLAASLVFALTLLAGLIASARIAYGFHVPAAVRQASQRLLDLGRAQTVDPARAREPLAVSGMEPERARARVIADAAASAERRERGAAAQAPRVQLIERGGNPQTPSRGPEAATVQPIGQSARRRTGNRVSAGRDRRNAL